MTIAKVAFDLPVVIGHVDHDFLDAMPRQVFDDVFQYRLAQNGDYRFGMPLVRGRMRVPGPRQELALWSFLGLLPDLVIRTPYMFQQSVNSVTSQIVVDICRGQAA